MKVNHDSVIGRNESITITKRFRACGQIANSVYSDSKEELIKKVVSKKSFWAGYSSRISQRKMDNDWKVYKKVNQKPCILTEKQRGEGLWD